MYRLVVLLVMLGFLFGCGSESSPEVEIPDDITFTVIKDKKKDNIKRSVEVVLNKKVDMYVLEILGEKLKKSVPEIYQRTFIGYFIENNDKKSGYWATTHFNPDLEVKILGLTIEDEEKLTIDTESSNRDVIGSWLSTRPGMGAKITLYYEGEKLLLESAYSDGSTDINEMMKKNTSGGLRIEGAGGNNYGEYFIVNSSNDLEFWVENDNYYTAKKYH